MSERDQQTQFLNAIDRDEAERRFQAHLKLQPLGEEEIVLSEARNRILATTIISQVDVPAFDRSNVDGFAVHAADTYGASEAEPKRVALTEEQLTPGCAPIQNVHPGIATSIATGAMIPRGADAVVMVEDTDIIDAADGTGALLEIRRSVSPGQAISFAGTDIAQGETVLRKGQQLTSREIGVLAAIGQPVVTVYRKPTVAIISTGDEIIPPGATMTTGKVYDSNAAILSAAVEELGGIPKSYGVVSDDLPRLQEVVAKAMEQDLVLLSGGTSKGAGDLSYQVVSQLNDPGIVAHGVALKPGKPICLAVTTGKPVVILPGFPTSAIFTFHEFVAPVIRAFGGHRHESRSETTARLPVKINSDRGRTEYLLVSLVEAEDGFVAYPLGKGSGSVTTFSHADGFITIPQHTEIVQPDVDCTVQLLDESMHPADLVMIGSHCIGTDVLLSELMQAGLTTKVLSVGSQAGLNAAKRGECDVAGIHLLDEKSGQYNQPFLTEDLQLIPGYRRMQGFVFRPDDDRFSMEQNHQENLAVALAAPGCRMINRNAGSGTRMIIDQLLNGQQPEGYAIQPKSHNAVATAILQQRADWGVLIESVARLYKLPFVPIREEHYDFVIPKLRLSRPAVVQFCKILKDNETRVKLAAAGFLV